MHEKKPLGQPSQALYFLRMWVFRLPFPLFLLFFTETDKESYGQAVPWEKGWIQVAPTVTYTVPGETSPEQAVLIWPRSSAPEEWKLKGILHVPFIACASLQSAFSENSISWQELASELYQSFGQNKAGSWSSFYTLSPMHSFCQLTALGYPYSADKINLVHNQDSGIWSKWGDKNHKGELYDPVTDKVTEQGLIQILA